MAAAEARALGGGDGEGIVSPRGDGEAGEQDSDNARLLQLLRASKENGLADEMAEETGTPSVPMAYATKSYYAGDGDGGGEGEVDVEPPIGKPIAAKPAAAIVLQLD